MSGWTLLSTLTLFVHKIAQRAEVFGRHVTDYEIFQAVLVVVAMTGHLGGFLGGVNYP
jgi:hypothetical protein